ncbi:MAG TPA: HAMP domain-containing histidine kinase [Clostridiales bacterium]|nr:HAMP domain-containing histidine kinase [Clostridiales bacterium]
MKNNVFRSFRFEIVLYSLISLIYTLLSVAVVYVGVYLFFFREEGKTLSTASFTVLSVISGSAAIILFITYFLILTKKFVIYMGRIVEGINEISQGNFSHRVIIKNEDEFAIIADKLNEMADNINNIMENERKSENAKNELITSVAHDLRTPLTSIIGYLDLVSTKELSPETQVKYVEIAYNKSLRLENLIEDLFTYTKFDFGEVQPVMREVDLVKLINQLLDEFYPRFQDYKLEYSFQTSVEAAVINVDGDLLARALANLISNAITYGKSGRYISINLDKQEGCIVISIINYGDVIPEADLKKIFQKFYRVETSRSSETGGSGLGLAIADRIISIHGGTLVAKSDSNGTVFTVYLKN